VKGGTRGKKKQVIKVERRGEKEKEPNYILCVIPDFKD
jgi:hypothetical protein